MTVHHEATFGPAEWNRLLAEDVHWREAYADVERVARLRLDAWNPEIELSTAELVELLYPERFAVGAGIYTRRRIFKALAALATRGLSDYCHKGKPRLNKMKQKIEPWLWHRPNEGTRARVRPVVTPEHEQLQDAAVAAIAEWCMDEECDTAFNHLQDVLAEQGRF